MGRKRDLMSPASGKMLNEKDEVVDISQIYDNFNRTFSPFDEQLSSQRTPIIEINASYAPSILRDVHRTEGTAEISQVDSEFELKHVGAGDKVIMVSASTGRYTPGIAAEAGVGVRFPD